MLKSRTARWLAGGIAAAAVLAPAVVWALFVPLADWLARHDVGSATGALHETALDNARGRLLTLGAGLVALVAVGFTARTYRLSREGQVTDRYTKAIEQLGSDKTDVRIGAIYALERIASDSARDHPVVMEVLSAFVREHAREEWPGPEGLIWPDVQAALTVIGRRDQKRDIRPIDLTAAILHYADLAEAKLAGAVLFCTDFTGAALHEAILTDANLDGALLNSAVLSNANLTRADLAGAHLDGANLTGADLDDAMWPDGEQIPDGWELDAGSGRLRRAGTSSGPAEAS